MTTSPLQDKALPLPAAYSPVLSPKPFVRVVSRDTLGKPRFMMGQPARSSVQQPTLAGESTARAHLLHQSHVFGLSEQAASDAEVQSVQQLPAGAALVQFKQSARGHEVFGARASVLMDTNGELVSLANQLSGAALGEREPTWAPAEPAIARAYTLLADKTLSAEQVQSLGNHGEWQEFSVTTAPEAPQVVDAAARTVLFPQAEKLTPAYHVELLVRGAHSRQDRAHGYVLAAADGRVLYSASLTASDAFQYRVFADASGHPSDGPLVDASPYPRGGPERLQLSAAEPILINMEGFNHNPDGHADPWLGAMDTYTFGNNVRAYSDRNQYVDALGVAHHDGYDDGTDIRADLTGPLKFDREYDVTKAPNASPDQIKAAITQLFYVTNWLHDYWYDSGFDESAKNAQQSNFKRGGIEGDPLRAEAQDSADNGISNNANMSTFSDGRSPRMQMYVWSGPPNRTLETSPALTFEDDLGAASFGPQTFDMSSPALPLVLSDDGSKELPVGTTGKGTTSDACQKPSNVAGKIAVVDRGVCPFATKAQNAQQGGALGVLLLDNTPGHAAPSPSASGGTIAIPLLGLSYEDGQKLKALLASTRDQPVLATRFMRGMENLNDGTIDNTIVAHEWGHYLHHRLVLCGSPSCDGMSEGWADFNALMLVIREQDTFAGKVYPLAQYAAAGLNQNASYFGIRRAPYSVDLNRNPFTFQHVRHSAELPTTAPLTATSSDMNEVHNVGEVWAQTLFDAYVGLIEQGRAVGRPFEETKRRMADYVVAGMKAAPVEPGFVEQRDAILSSVYAMSKGDPSRLGDFAALARGFAKRGLGVGAAAPPTDSESLDEATESFAFSGELTVSDVSLDDSTKSCDHDGILDDLEAGQLSFTVTNSGWSELTQARVRVSPRDNNVKVDDGGVVQIGKLLPFAAMRLHIGVSAERVRRGKDTLRFLLRPSDPDAINSDIDLPFDLRYNYDDVPSVNGADAGPPDEGCPVVTSANRAAAP